MKHTKKSLRKLYLAKKYNHGIKKKRRTPFQVWFYKNIKSKKLKIIMTPLVVEDFQFAFKSEIKPRIDHFVHSFKYAVESLKVK
jgi:hypothetical protein